MMAFMHIYNLLVRLYLLRWLKIYAVLLCACCKNNNMRCCNHPPTPACVIPPFPAAPHLHTTCQAGGCGPHAAEPAGGRGGTG